jgi:redox-sensing transcriptional repressor
MSYTVGRDDQSFAQPGADKPGEKLSLGVAARLSRYLQVLTQARKMGKTTISSQELADYTHVNSTQIRRDLSGFGKFGKRGVGYNIESLVTQIRKIMRTSGQHNIALFGAGHLGTAIATSDIFADHGFRVVAVFDNDEGKVGEQIGPLTVRHNSEMLAVPSAAAQELADELADAGMKIMFNYSDALLHVPPEVTVHTSSPAVDLLYALYFYLT